MKRFGARVLIFAVFIAGIAFVYSCSGGGGESVTPTDPKVVDEGKLDQLAEKRATIPLPVSLESFYPPKAEQPLYLFNMLAMDNFFLGIVVDVMEGDLPGARTNFEEFKSRYDETLKMVPEWKEYYPLAPVKKLGTELAEGDSGKVMAAFGEVGRLCHECHLSTMVQVQQKYRWGDFGGISVNDPLSKELTDYSTFKKYLSTSMAGISVNLRQGQTENARMQFVGFKERFRALKTSCLDCHDQEPRYFVDDSVESLLDELGQALNKQTVDPGAVRKLIQGIGRESCSKCHLVHVPAAFAGVR